MSKSPSTNTNNDDNSNNNNELQNVLYNQTYKTPPLGFHEPYLSNKKWLIDPHEYLMSSGNRKTLRWVEKMEQLGERGMIVIFGSNT